MTTTATSKHTTIWNRVAFTGRLGRDPEMSYTSTGKAKTTFSLAVNQGKEYHSLPRW